MSKVGKGNIKEPRSSPLAILKQTRAFLDSPASKINILPSILHCINQVSSAAAAGCKQLCTVTSQNVNLK